MMLEWFNAHEATEVGAALADQFLRQSAPSVSHIGGSAENKLNDALQDLLRRADGEVLNLRLNFYKKAKLGNSFRWRLIEKGIARDVAEEVTHSLMLRLSRSNAVAPNARGSVAALPSSSTPLNAKQLLARANDHFAKGSYSVAAAHYQTLVELDPRNPVALQNLGAAFIQLGLLSDAELLLRQAIDIKPDYADAHCNLGIAIRGRGETADSEVWLRRALKLNPRFEYAEIHLGVTLLALGRLRDAKARFTKVLKRVPRHTEAVYLMGHVAKLEGRFEEAEGRFKRALEINPKMSKAWAALAGTRKMTTSDTAWLDGAKQFIADELAPLEEVDVRFAMGKYCDDIEDFEQAFDNYRRANDLLRTTADSYDPDARRHFVDDMIHLYTPKTMAAVDGRESDSKKPIFVVGMPRSGTSLVEQIIASHPSANGAGELGFCDDSMQEQDSDLRKGLLSEPTRKGLAVAYLQALVARAGDSPRIVDKAPVNSDYLGAIYSVFPSARIVHMRRDPIDTCLSCYFQYFSVAMNYTMDLSQLAHYYREHKRLMQHWRSVLPAGSILEVPYAELVSDQVTWTRRILEFLELDWDDRCLNFHETRRQVVTASHWQVRQKIYRTSVARWRNYEKFIEPLLDLKD
jgi:tetratricopeptide (TPR) repeat protein